MYHVIASLNTIHSHQSYEKKKKKMQEFMEPELS